MSKSMSLVMSQETVEKLNAFRTAYNTYKSTEDSHNATIDSIKSRIASVEKQRQEKYSAIDETLSFTEYGQAINAIDASLPTTALRKELADAEQAKKEELKDLRADIKSAADFVPVDLYSAYKTAVSTYCHTAFYEEFDKFLDNLGVKTVGCKVRKVSEAIIPMIGAKVNAKKDNVDAYREKTFRENVITVYMDYLCNKGIYTKAEDGTISETVFEEA